MLDGSSLRCFGNRAALAAAFATAVIAGVAQAAPPKVISLSPQPEECIAHLVDATNGEPFNTIVVTFDQPVIIPANAIRTLARPTTHNVTSVVPLNTPTTSATVTFQQITANTVMRLVVSHSIENAAGEALDGDILDPLNPNLPGGPSGDGREGGEAVFEYHILTGDVDCDGVVAATDATIVNGAIPADCNMGHPSYNPRADLNLDGCINATDLNIVLTRAGNTLPGPVEYPPGEVDPNDPGVLPFVVNVTPTDLPLETPVIDVTFSELMDPVTAHWTITSAYLTNNGGALMRLTRAPRTNDFITYRFDFESLPALGNYSLVLSNSIRDINYEFLDRTVIPVVGADQDSDGILDDGDGDGSAGSNPCTGGNTVNCDDNCPQDPNPLQEDADNDGVGNVCDECPGTPADEEANADGCSCSQLDDDNDGTNNCDDLCPNTPFPLPFGVTVDDDGCACTQLDADGDGVDDCDDECDNTPANEEPNSRGCSCSQLDDDNDGVDNCDDLCPGTPANQADDVDSTGCVCSQIDEDNDGVNSCDDLCPFTPAGEPVDSDGCSASQLDDDGDGVPNSLDFCADTPSDEAADGRGCSASQRTDDEEPTPTPVPTPPPGGGPGGDDLADDDGDNVINSVDQCPDTPPGTIVDAVGCPVELSPGQEVPGDGDEDSGCGSGAPCGAMGLVSFYLLAAGFTRLKLSRRRRPKRASGR